MPDAAMGVMPAALSASAAAANSSQVCGRRLGVEASLLEQRLVVVPDDALAADGHASDRRRVGRVDDAAGPAGQLLAQRAPVGLGGRREGVEHRRVIEAGQHLHDVAQHRRHGHASWRRTRSRANGTASNVTVTPGFASWNATRAASKPLPRPVVRSATSQPKNETSPVTASGASGDWPLAAPIPTAPTSRTDRTRAVSADLRRACLRAEPASIPLATGMRRSSSGLRRVLEPLNLLTVPFRRASTSSPSTAPVGPERGPSTPSELLSVACCPG